MAVTFGNENIEALVWGTGNQINACKFTSGPVGTLAKLSVYITQSAAFTPNIKMYLYDAARNKVLNGETEQKVVGPGSNWMHFNFLVPPTVLAATEYWIAGWNGPSTCFYHHNGGDPNQLSVTGLAYDGWPAAINAGSTAWKLSMYATYTVIPQAPTAPTGLQLDGQSSPVGANCISDLTPGFSAIFEDPDAGDQSNAIQIQVGSASGLSDIWDSGWLADSTVEGNRCTAKTYAGAALSPGTSYWWRSRFRDDGNLVGAWSAWQQFDVCAVEGRTGSGAAATGIGAGGFECEPGGPLPKQIPFKCRTIKPRKEPAYRFPL